MKVFVIVIIIVVAISLTVGGILLFRKRSGVSPHPRPPPGPNPHPTPGPTPPGPTPGPTPPGVHKGFLHTINANDCAIKSTWSQKCLDPNYCDYPTGNKYDCQAGDQGCNCVYCCDKTTMYYDCSDGSGPPKCPDIEPCSLSFTEGSKWDLAIYEGSGMLVEPWGTFTFTADPSKYKVSLKMFDTTACTSGGYLVPADDYTTLLCVLDGFAIDYLVIQVKGVQQHYDGFIQTNKRQFVSGVNSNGKQMIISCL